MKKRTGILLLSAVLCVWGSASASAAENGTLPRMYDEADLLTDTEEESLTEMLDEISLRQECDVAAVTVASAEGESLRDFTDDFYDYNGYGQGENRDGILFLVSIEDREWYITTTGFGITALTDAGREYIADRFTEDLSDGNYAEAFETYAQLCDEFLTQAAAGEPYDSGNLPKEPMSLLWIPGSVLIGFVLAFLVMLGMRVQLKSVKGESSAGNYVKKGSMKLTGSRDIYLYSHISREEIEEVNSGSQTHTSSSGTEHGGGGGSF